MAEKQIILTQSGLEKLEKELEELKGVKRKEIAEKINALGKVPGPEMKRAFPDKQKGYGVINIATRLRLKYGDQVEFGYEVLEEGTRCVIKLPVDGKENYEQ